MTRVDQRHDHQPLAISQGDPAGIGPEIIVKALATRSDLAHDSVVHGDSVVLRDAAHRLGLPPPPNIEVVTYSREKQLEIGVESAATGDHAYRCVLSAARSVLAGNARALVTAPLSKHAMNLAGHTYPGHTELLAETAGDCPVRMMLANPELRVVLVTIHEPLARAVEMLDQAIVEETIEIAARALTISLGRAPRLAVAGLNPHAGESGLLGREEIEIISPAIESAKRKGIDAQGPLPPDTVFMSARGLRTFDAVIAMYHDQGLIPVKYLGVEDGVNVTLGLPFVRTSPDHGTAFDIAGKGIAQANSMMCAIRAAVEMTSPPDRKQAES
ncbi:MAG: 4-hydroxythreonine-4-phosphate dehydrogenase PdxA [Burkholderiaceae bacterium]